MDTSITRRDCLGLVTIPATLSIGCLETDEPATSSPTETRTATPTTPSATPAETPEPSPTDTPTDTPTPDRLPYELSEGGQRSLPYHGPPGAVVKNDSWNDHEMTVLRSKADAEQLDTDELTDEQVTFVDGTDFDDSVIVAGYFAFPQAGSVDVDVFYDSDTIVVHVEYRVAGHHVDGDHVLFVRVTPDDSETPEHATIVIKNDPANDHERIEFGTADDSVTD